MDHVGGIEWQSHFQLSQRGLRHLVRRTARQKGAAFPWPIPATEIRQVVKPKCNEHNIVALDCVSHVHEPNAVTSS